MPNCCLIFRKPLESRSNEVAAHLLLFLTYAAIASLSVTDLSECVGGVEESRKCFDLQSRTPLLAATNGPDEAVPVYEFERGLTVQPFERERERCRVPQVEFGDL